MDKQAIVNSILNLSETVGHMLNDRKLVLTTAESCTGGLISSYITAVSGSSSWFDRAFITYTNKAKMEMLEVTSDCLDNNGAVSEETVRQMSLGALKHSDADISVAVSGIAGPTGGTLDKPVGTVWISWAYKNEIIKTYKALYNGDREMVRLQTVEKALIEIKDFLKQI